MCDKDMAPLLGARLQTNCFQQVFSRWHHHLYLHILDCDTCADSTRKAHQEMKWLVGEEKMTMESATKRNIRS